MNEQFLEIVKEALANVRESYYRLVTTYEPGGIVRERVFCYELYHQIRIGMTRRELFDVHALHGEIDKSGHEDFAVADRRNPDFVLHVPGNHEDNAVVIEVKGTLRSPSKVFKDFQTLTNFLNYGYKTGIFILFNHSFEELTQRVNEETRALAAEHNNAPIYIFSIPRAGMLVEEHRLADLVAAPIPQ